MFSYLFKFFNSLYYYFFPTSKRQGIKYYYNVLVYITKKDHQFKCNEIDNVFGIIKLKDKNRKVYYLPISDKLDKTVDECINEYCRVNNKITCFVYLFYFNDKLVNVYVTNEIDLTCEGCQLMKEVLL
jgi:hypothetical protein